MYLFSHLYPLIFFYAIISDEIEDMSKKQEYSKMCESYVSCSFA